MANPFLVLGGIAVGIVTAAMGVLQVPGWVKSAQDASAINDLGSAAVAEGAASALGLGYMTGAGLRLNEGRIGAAFTLSDGVKLCITRNEDATEYAAVAISPSGAFFARTTGVSKAVEGATADEALDAVGGLPEGVEAPVIGSNCAPGAEIITGDGDGAGGGDNENEEGSVGGVTRFNDSASVAHTSHGTYAINLSAGEIVKDDADGRAHKVNTTGLDISLVDAGLASDAAGNLYFLALDNDAFNTYANAWSEYWTEVGEGGNPAEPTLANESRVVVKMTPSYKLSVVKVLSYDHDQWYYDIDDNENGDVFVMDYGKIFQLSGDTFTQTGEWIDRNTRGSYPFNGRSSLKGVDQAGNLYILDPTATNETLFRMAPNGDVTSLGYPHTVDPVTGYIDNQHVVYEFGLVEVGSDGAVYVVQQIPTAAYIELAERGQQVNWSDQASVDAYYAYSDSIDRNSLYDNSLAVVTASGEIVQRTNLEQAMSDVYDQLPSGTSASVKLVDLDASGNLYLVVSDSAGERPGVIVKVTPTGNASVVLRDSSL